MGEEADKSPVSKFMRLSPYPTKKGDTTYSWTFFELPVPK